MDDWSSGLPARSNHLGKVEECWELGVEWSLFTLHSHPDALDDLENCCGEEKTHIRERGDTNGESSGLSSEPKADV